MIEIISKRFKDKTKEESLTEILKYLQDQLDLAERTSTSRDVYDKASWPFFQADINGQKRILRKIIEYIK